MRSSIKTKARRRIMSRRRNVSGRNIHTVIGLSKDDASSRPLLKVASFNDHNHMSVLCQHVSSIWPYVLPYCIANTLFTIFLWIWNSREDAKIGQNMGIDPSGHKYMAALLSFLVIARVIIIYNRYMMARAFLEQMFQSGQEFVQLAFVMTKSIQSQDVKKWRQEVAFGTIDMVRETMRAIEYQSSLPMLPQKRRQQEIMQLEYYKRAPSTKAWTLRTIILEPRSHDEMHSDMFGQDADVELKLLAITGCFLGGELWKITQVSSF